MAIERRTARKSLLIVAVIGLAVVVRLWISYEQRREAVERYVETNGKVRSFRSVERVRSPNDPILYDLVPTIEYSVGGTKCLGEPPVYDSKQIAALKIGDSIALYYNPDRPSEFVAFEKSFPPVLAGIVTALYLIFLIISKDLFKG